MAAEFEISQRDFRLKWTIKSDVLVWGELVDMEYETDRRTDGRTISRLVHGGRLRGSSASETGTQRGK